MTDNRSALSLLTSMAAIQAKQRPNHHAAMEDCKPVATPFQGPEGACSTIDLRSYLLLPVQHPTGYTLSSRRSGQRLP